MATVLLVYYSTPFRARWFVLLIASTVFFYLNGGWTLYAMFIAQTLLAWGGSLLINKYESSKNDKLKNRTALVVIAVEIAALVLMKESSFFIINANIITRLINPSSNISYLGWIAPLGMSYYTLMLISYTTNVLWGKAESQKNPLKLMLYAGFFLQMVSGPFTCYEKISAQLYEGHKFNLREFQFGLQRLLWGLFKKLVIAERLAIIVTTIYDGELEGTWTPTGTYIIIGAFAYVFQLYTDFSGCMDIVLGVAQMFGIKLPENFRTPFYSTNLSEFWRRWHITLGLWLKDYMMYPVQKALTTKFGKAAKKKFGRVWGKNVILYASMLATWFGIGFWHGGSWKYICASGLFFFVMIVGGLLLEPVFSRLTKLLRIDTEAWSWTLFARLRTACLFTLSVSFGRALSLSDGLKMWSRVFELNPWIFVDGSLYRLGLDRLDFWMMIFGLALIYIISQYQQKGSVREIVARQNLVFRWVLYLGLFIAVLLFGMYGEGYNPADFIYGGF